MSRRHVVQHRNKPGNNERQVVLNTFIISKPELSEKSSFNQTVLRMCLENYGPALLTIPSKAVWTLDQEFLFVY